MDYFQILIPLIVYMFQGIYETVTFFSLDLTILISLALILSP